ncbi:hypothetical protein SANTM175S_07698 [Streptomyces antimycoticus]
MTEYSTGTSARPALYGGQRHRVLWVVGVVFSAGLLAPLLFLGAARKGIVPRTVPAGYAVAVYPIALGRQWLPDRVTGSHGLPAVFGAHRRYGTSGRRVAAALDRAAGPVAVKSAP